MGGTDESPQSIADILKGSGITLTLGDNGLELGVTPGSPELFKRMLEATTAAVDAYRAEHPDASIADILKVSMESSAAVIDEQG